MSPASVTYDLTIPCEALPGANRRAPAIYMYVERVDGTIRSVLTLLDTGAAISVFDGEVARSGLGFDPSQDPLDVVPLAGLTSRERRVGYVHEVRCYVGGQTSYLDLRLHVAFTGLDGPALPFNVLGREGLDRNGRRGFFDQVQFGYRHHVAGSAPEVYLSRV